MGDSTMMKLSDAARVLPGRLAGADVAIRGITTDSRRVSAGDLFVALVGERFDGHAYVAEALRRGASAAMVSRELTDSAPFSQVVVDDTRAALGRLAGHWREKFAIPLAALTGSNGKTTVKEMLAAILAQQAGGRAHVLATQGNLNNDIGMPLTLLSLRAGHRFAVIEMGMNHEGEIEYLTRIARPNVALVNNAQRAHVGLLGSIEAIARAKGEIYAGLGPGGAAIVNDDDAFASYWRGLNRGRRILSFGFKPEADVRGGVTADGWRIVTPSGSFTFAPRVRGEHNLRNAMAASAAAFALDVPVEAMRAGLAEFSGVAGRLQRRRGPGASLVIDDSYNANPESMRAALRVLAEERARKVFVMGDMGELGSESAAMHAEVGAYAREVGVNALLALGPASREAAHAFGEGARHFTEIEALREAARAEAAAGAAILVKGSRFMQMERVADALAEEGGHAV
ncbi:MAG TPA: UDP-N-acetylmuramoyl-tripeptide--D-alanyl-D-alanine ligase [Usitatibacter sp.]|nr:UDP-N-acetylmuramoyl-tripeptide--D-alanyl-D-alanine ligase [Usitatibacter sp.]